MLSASFWWWCLCVLASSMSVMATPIGSAATLITSNNPHAQQHQSVSITKHQSSSSSINRAPVTEWEALYDKEIGTWCAPADEQSPTDTTTTTTVKTTTTTSSEGMVPQQVPVAASQSSSSGDTSHQRPAEWMAIQHAPPVHSSDDNGDTSMLTRWVDAALRIIRNNHASASAPCADDQDEASCKQHSFEKRSLTENRPVPGEMNLYVAMNQPHQQATAGGGAAKLSAVLPDGPLKGTGPRDAWIVLDPTPHLSFGHTVYVFVVDFETSDATCIANSGVPLEGGDCVTQVFKTRCPNPMVRRAARWPSSPRRRRAPSSASDLRRSCDIDFLPLVHPHNSAPSQLEQRLVCTERVPGFAPCPALRSWNETSELICDPLSTNHKRCDSTQELVKTRCRLFETCDQAVLLTGGWSWQLSGKREVHHLLSMYRMLRRNGFGKHSIKIFFANGVRAGPDNHDDDESEDDSESSTGDKDLSPGPFFVPSPSDVHQRVEDDGVKESTPHREHHHHRHHHHHHRHDHYPANKRPAMYPAALKIALRNHIRTLCGTPHCVDSFVVYLSSPTRTSDGASLLWDADHNGVFDETEVYTVREFLRDIQDCAARQVVVLADQNQSGLLAEALGRSRRHSNVLMFTSSQSSQHTSATGELTHHWANYAHGHACLSQVYKDSLNTMQYSKPRFEDSSNGTLVYNLFGAPCDVVPPYSLTELKTHYMGCQYVPTRIWLSRQGSATDPPPRLLTG